MVTTKIQIKTHLREYLIGKFCGCQNIPVRFPDRLDIYHTIWDLTERRPTNCQVDYGNLEIVLPERTEGKSPDTYNYLGQRSQRIIERKIENMFLAEVHDTVTEQKQRYGITYLDTIHSILCRYDINALSSETLWKDYYRWKCKLHNRKKRAYKKSISI